MRTDTQHFSLHIYARVVAISLWVLQLQALAQTDAQVTLSTAATFSPLITLEPGHAKLLPTHPVDQLSKEEIARFKQLWSNLGVGDVPPYPKAGTGELLDLVTQRAKELHARETLIVVADVDETGQVTHVKPRRYSDDQLLKSVTWLLVDTPFLPARCNGQPCKSTFPLIARVPK